MSKREGLDRGWVIQNKDGRFRCHGGMFSHDLRDAEVFDRMRFAYRVIDSLSLASCIAIDVDLWGD